MAVVSGSVFLNVDAEVTGNPEFDMVIEPACLQNFLNALVHSDFSADVELITDDLTDHEDFFCWEEPVPTTDCGDYAGCMGGEDF